MKKKAISFTPFDNRNNNGQPSIGPVTEKSVLPTNNVHTIQDVLNGKPYKIPGGGGHWSSGEEAKPGSFKENADDYKRQERDMSIIREMMKGVPFSAGIHPLSSEIWRVKVPGGSKDFPSFNQAERYKEKVRERGVFNAYVTRIAQSNQTTRVIAESLEKTFMVESINVAEGVKETGSAFCVAPGYFVTCAHVIKNYNKNQGGNIFLDLSNIFVNIYYEDTTRRAEVIDIASEWDIALLKCDIESDYFKLEDPIVGQSVIAVGSPHGYENNISKGTVGSLDRKVYDYKDAPNYLFADMSIFPGNSGGPVINEETGKVVGMVTLIVSSVGGYGLNACLPSDYIRKFCSRSINI